MIKRTTALLFCLLLAFVGWLPGKAAAQGLNLVRDAEIENTIRLYATPLFRAAGLNPNAITLYLVNDKSLNAFVAGGRNMFIHTGLLMEADGPLEVIGVLAHETGHISGGHLASRTQAIKTAQTSALITTLLGIGAAIATGQGGLAGAVASGGQDVALKNLLTYTRSQEASADQAALTFLTATKQSPRGLMTFMEKLQGQEVLFTDNQDPYLRSHPLSEDRIIFFRDQTEKSPYKDVPASPDLIERHDRMVAKLTGFLEPLSRVLRKYPESDQTVPGRYARAIAYYRKGNLDQALPIIDSLIAEHPEDPYFHELKGQVLFENGRIDESVTEYEIAKSKLPNSGLIRQALAQAQLETNDPALIDPALENLEVILQHEPNNAFAWRLTAIGHGRKGDKAETSLALAEAALARGEYGEAVGFAKRAEGLLDAGSPGWLRSQDIANEAERLQKERR